MAVFEYKAIDSNGKLIKGIIDADNPKAARVKLRRTGIFPTELVEEKGTVAKVVTKREVTFDQLLGRIKSQDISILTRQLATLLIAGLTLIEALTALTEQFENVKLKKVLSQIREKVNEGSSFADALKNFPKVFSDLYVNMIRAGESSGALDIVLMRLADFLENQLKLKNRISSTLVYPAFMLIFMGVIVVFLMTFVIPKITDVFENIGQTLPFYTQLLISISDFLRNFWWALIILAIMIGVAFKRMLRVPSFQERYDSFKLKLPIFGKLIRKVEISRFTRTLSTLLNSGIPLLVSMDIVKNIVANKILEGAIEDARVSISEGSAIAEPLKRSNMFPPIVTHMITVGERSGELEKMLLKVSEAYDNEVETTVSGLTSLLEPVMILVMGGVVFFIMISILLPILQMNQVIH